MNSSSAQVEQLRKDTEDSLMLLRSDEWKQYIKFLKERSVKLQAKVNASVREGNFVDAQINLALMEDGLRQADLFRQAALQSNANLQQKEQPK